MSRIFVGVVAGVAVLSACLPSVDVGDAFIACAADAECPAGLVCDIDAALCAPPGVVRDVIAPAIVDAAVDLEVLGPGQTATVSFTTSEDLGKTPRVFFERDVDGDGVDVPLVVDGSGSSWQATLTPGADDQSGSFALLADLQDAAANVAERVRLRAAVDFDLTPPRAVVTTITIGANAITNPLAPGNPRSLRRDSDVQIVVAFDEDLAATSTLSLSLDEQRINAPAGLVDANITTFAIPAAFFATAADGVWTLTIEVADLLGNAGGGALSDVLVVDNLPPPPPTFQRLVRAPWGSAQTDVITAVEAAAVDAALLLVLTDGTTVNDDAVPPHIARAQPDAAGGVNLELAFDVVGLQLVAVDDAGNMSVPASALRTEVVATVRDPTSPHQLLARPVLRDALLQAGDRPIDEALRAGPVTTSAQPFWQPLTTQRRDVVGTIPLVAFDPVGANFLLLADGATFRVDGAQVIRDPGPLLPARSGGALATDLARGRVVLFGGDDAGGTARNDLWEWDGQRWLEVLPNNAAATDRPRPRVGHAMAWVPDLGGIVVVNGCGSDVEIGIAGCVGENFHDVWVFDGVAFQQLCEGASCGDDQPLAFQPGLAVDDNGALLTTEGFLIPGIGRFPPPPPLRRFDGARWVAECEFPCGEGLPALPDNNFGTPAPTIASLPGGGGVVVVGSCEGVPCLGRYHDGEFTHAPISGGPVPQVHGLFQQPALAIAPSGELLIASTRFGAPTDTEIWRIDVDAHADRAVPSAISPRCNGAAVNDNGPMLVGGCQSCQAFGGDLVPSCEAATANRELLLNAGVRVLADAALGSVVAAAVGANNVIVDVDGSDLQSLVDGTPAQRVPAAGRLPLLLMADPDGAGRWLLLSTTDQSGFADRIDVVSNNGVFGNVCAGSCGLQALSIGVAGAGASGEFSVLFGSDFLDTTTLLVVDGALTPITPAPVPSPNGRRFPSAAFDTGRGGAWFVGGTVRQRQQTGNGSPPCREAGGSSDCNDLWFFDGAAWTDVRTVDLGSGVLPPRFLAQTIVVDGDLVVGGGISGNGTNASPLTDAWRLQAGGLAPAHLLRTSLDGMGSDAFQPLLALSPLWCGGATDGNGDDVDVDLLLWTGQAFVPLTTALEGLCRRGTLPAGVSLAGAARDADRGVFVAVRPAEGGAVRGAGFASITTTALELTATFGQP